MAKEQQVNKPPAQTKLHEQAILDWRLSQLEVSIIISGLFCLLVFGAVFLNNQILTTHSVQMTSRAQSVVDWIAESHKVRVRNAGLTPVRCQRAKNPLSMCFQDMVAPGQPFEGLKIFIQLTATLPLLPLWTCCIWATCWRCHDHLRLSIFPPRSEREAQLTGVIIVQPATIRQFVLSRQQSVCRLL